MTDRRDGQIQQESLLYLTDHRASLRRALDLATRSLKRKSDKAGQPAILHALRVLARVGSDPVTQVVAILHDVVEDTYVSMDDIEADFGLLVREGVESVTRHALGMETYAKFIERAAAHSVGRVVKRADVEDHLDDHGTGFELSTSMKTRYAKALLVLPVPVPMSIHISRRRRTIAIATRDLHAMTDGHLDIHTGALGRGTAKSLVVQAERLLVDAIRKLEAAEANQREAEHQAKETTS